MFNISFGEILVFAIIALIVLGPEKFPQALRSAMQKYQKLKTMLNKVQQDFENELELMELKQLMQDELARIKQNEAELKATLAKMQQELDEVQQSNVYPSNTSQYFMENSTEKTIEKTIGKSTEETIIYFYKNQYLHTPYLADFNPIHPKQSNVA